jgi:hypothetical protein
MGDDLDAMIAAAERRGQRVLRTEPRAKARSAVPTSS